MDVVLPVRSGANEELRFALRSLRNYPHEYVWIFGDKPDWVTNIRFVETPQDGNKHRNVNTAIRLACEHPDVSDPYVLANDDMYFMEPTTEIPVYNLGTIRDVAAAYQRQGINSDYVQGMIRTAQHLEALGYRDPLSFETHTPIVVHKRIMLDALNHGPYQRRSVYGNLAGLTGDTIRDVKIHRRRSVPRGPFLSTSDRAFPIAYPHLARTFPKPSPYEN